MSRGKKLVEDIFLFGIGNFAVKIFQFLLLPIYTTYLTTDEYGTAELLNNFSEIIFPLVVLCVYESLFRMLIDDKLDKKYLFTNAVAVSIVGYLFCLVLIIIYSSITQFEYVYAFELIIFAQIARILFSNFSRGLGKTRIIAVSGILNGVALLACNYFVLVVFNFGINGYLLSIGFSNLISALILLIGCRAFRYFNLSLINSRMIKLMLAYSIPIIPSLLAWNVINLTGRYTIDIFSGSAAAGLYLAASKLPAIINALSNVFHQAWNYSASKALGDHDSSEYYVSVSNFYIVSLTLAGGLVLLVSPLLSELLLKKEFIEASVYVPYLLLGSIVSAEAVLFEGYYVAKMDMKHLMFSTLWPALANLAFSIAMVPLVGIWGAVVASNLSFLILVCLRIRYFMMHSEKQVDVRAIIITYLGLVVLSGAVTLYPACWISALIYILVCIVVICLYRGTIINFISNFRKS